MRIRTLLAAFVVAVVAAPATQAATAERFNAVVNDIFAQPYQPNYVPLGFDSAFAPALVPNTFPVEDYTTGSIPGNPDHPGWPAAFQLVEILSLDGAPLISRLALHPGKNPGVVVVHGFNTNAKESVVRWAAMLYANGYNVLAVDQRDFRAEWLAGKGFPTWRQTFGWKEATDVLAGGRYLAAQTATPGGQAAEVTSVGVFGFSLGGQDTVLALELDGKAPRTQRVFDAAMNFSGPADQNTQIYSTAFPPGCIPPACEYPVTDALVNRVVPPYGQVVDGESKYTNPCQVLRDAEALYGPSEPEILAHEMAYRSQLGVKVPLLNVYAADDELVLSFQATMMAGYNSGKPLQRTLLLQRGNHAYFYDRWWQQRAILRYFKGLLPGASRDRSITSVETVNQTPGGTPAEDQLVPLGSPTRQGADALRAPYWVCPG